VIEYWQQRRKKMGNDFEWYGEEFVYLDDVCQDDEGWEEAEWQKNRWKDED
jgi:hypothetical protein